MINILPFGKERKSSFFSFQKSTSGGSYAVGDSSLVTSSPHSLSDGAASGEFGVDSFQHSVSDSILSHAGVAPPEQHEFTHSVFSRSLPQDAVDLVSIRFFGRRPAIQFQIGFSLVFAASVVALAIIGSIALKRSSEVAGQVGMVGSMMVNSQLLANSVSQALLGDVNSFANVRDSGSGLANAYSSLKNGDPERNLKPLDDVYKPRLISLEKRVASAEASSKFVASQKEFLIDTEKSLRALRQEADELYKGTEAILALRMQENAPIAEIGNLNEMEMLTQRIGLTSKEFYTAETLSQEAASLLSKDLTSFSDLSKEIIGGTPLSPEEKNLHLKGDVNDLLKSIDFAKKQATQIVEKYKTFSAVRQAQRDLIAESEPLRKDIEALQSSLSTGVNLVEVSGMALFALLIISSSVALAYVEVKRNEARYKLSVARILKSKEDALLVRQSNASNEAAILLLMDELQALSEGDLTRQATVTGTVTGAIADSVNYTIQEFRAIVANINRIAVKVNKTTSEVDLASVVLLRTSGDQLKEMKKTRGDVSGVAERVTDMSNQALQTSKVARQSRTVTEEGLNAVQESINGMNRIRDQIQEASKRVKRLGESSQEIGEITDIITNITEQTSMLALNAAVQAASSGSAGGAFAVVAQEVQDLAVRSGEAANQIAKLVDVIQGDTMNAIASMEKSTHDVIQGAKLADNAGAALSEIDRLSSRVEYLINQISEKAKQESEKAQSVARDIQRISALTEQNSSGTVLTVKQVRQLSAIVNDLLGSVSRFKLNA